MLEAMWNYLEKFTFFVMHKRDTLQEALSGSIKGGSGESHMVTEGSFRMAESI